MAAAAVVVVVVAEAVGVGVGVVVVVQDQTRQKKTRPCLQVERVESLVLVGLGEMVLAAAGPSPEVVPA